MHWGHGNAYLVTSVVVAHANLSNIILSQEVQELV